MAAWYDPTTSAVVPAFQLAGIQAVRWPGGSWSDDYHWATNTMCGNTPNSNATFANFVNDLVLPGQLRCCPYRELRNQFHLQRPGPTVRGRSLDHTGEGHQRACQPYDRRQRRVRQLGRRSSYHSRMMPPPTLPPWGTASQATDTISRSRQPTPACWSASTSIRATLPRGIRSCSPIRNTTSSSTTTIRRPRQRERHLPRRSRQPRA